MVTHTQFDYNYNYIKFHIAPLQQWTGAVIKEKLGLNKLQNFGQFWTTSDFDRKYLRNGSRYPKLES